MLEILREAATQIPAIKTYGGLSALSIVGIGLHWGNPSSLEWPALMDFDSNRLLH
jgi:hypothetical protein